jgi:osmotically-inducible protein OsmY
MMNKKTNRRRALRRPVSKLVLAAAALVLLAACSPKAERRTFGTFIDDQAAEVKIHDVLYARPEFDDRDHIKVEAHNETLLLAGEVSSEKKKQTAGELALELKAISRVVNELAVMPPQDTSGKLHNSYITSKVNTKLLTSNPIEGLDSSRIKVITARGTVYLMGTVSRAEGDAVAEVARTTGGVEKVVKVFHYSD